MEMNLQAAASASSSSHDAAAPPEEADADSQLPTDPESLESLGWHRLHAELARRSLPDRGKVDVLAMRLSLALLEEPPFARGSAPESAAAAAAESAAPSPGLLPRSPGLLPRQSEELLQLGEERLRQELARRSLPDAGPSEVLARRLSEAISEGEAEGFFEGEVIFSKDEVEDEGIYDGDVIFPEGEGGGEDEGEDEGIYDGDVVFPGSDVAGAEEPLSLPIMEELGGICEEGDEDAEDEDGALEESGAAGMPQLPVTEPEALESLGWNWLHGELGRMRLPNRGSKTTLAKRLSLVLRAGSSSALMERRGSQDSEASGLGGGGGLRSARSSLCQDGGQLGGAGAEAPELEKLGWHRLHLELMARGLPNRGKTEVLAQRLAGALTGQPKEPAALEKFGWHWLHNELKRRALPDRGRTEVLAQRLSVVLQEQCSTADVDNLTEPEEEAETDESGGEAQKQPLRGPRKSVSDWYNDEEDDCGPEEPPHSARDRSLSMWFCEGRRPSGVTPETRMYDIDDPEASEEKPHDQLVGGEQKLQGE